MPNIENTGMEGWYFRELVQTEKLIHVKLTNGEEFHSEKKTGYPSDFNHW